MCIGHSFCVFSLAWNALILLKFCRYFSVELSIYWQCVKLQDTWLTIRILYVCNALLHCENLNECQRWELLACNAYLNYRIYVLETYENNFSLILCSPIVFTCALVWWITRLRLLMERSNCTSSQVVSSDQRYTKAKLRQFSFIARRKRYSFSLKL